MSRVAFCVGTGRCGTTFLAEVAGLEPHVAASHERLRLAATFHMYCQWHSIDVDPEGFLVDREAAIREDLSTHEVSFEASALLSHSIQVLHERFDARFVLLVRDPAATVASFVVRGWFREPVVWADPTRPPTYREGMEPRHFFGRNLPRSPAAWEAWKAMTPVGRLAWFWQARNGAILDQLAALPADRSQIVRLEDLDWPTYRDLASFLGWQSRITPAQFDAVARRRPNAGPNEPRGPEHWSARERSEFHREVDGVARRLGYR